MIEAQNLRIEKGRTLFDVDGSTYQIISLTSRDANKLDFIQQTIGWDAIKLHALFHSIVGSNITFKTVLELTSESGNWRIECLTEVYHRRVSVRTAARYLRLFGGAVCGWQDAPIHALNNKEGKQIAEVLR